MNDQQRLDDLLEIWQERCDRGDAPTVTDLCRDTPQLQGQLEKSIAVLQRFQQLREPEEAIAGAAATPAAIDTPTIDQPRSSIGGFALLGKLSEGGMGFVYLARDPRADRSVAIKLMKPEVAVRPDSKDRFLREARALAKIRHENVVPIYHVDEENGTPYFVMPLLEGESLEDRLKRIPPGCPRSLAWQEAATIARQAAEGLAAIHDRQLIHRDIKPGNIFLVAREVAMILDFGLVRPEKSQGELTQAGAIVGTWGYMPPEVYEGEQLDARGDLFSLGCVLYRMVTGQLPFDAGSTAGIMKATIAGTMTPVGALNPQAPAALVELIGRLLAIKRSDRPGSAREVARCLQSLLEGSAVETGVHEAPVRSVTQRLPARWRLLAAGLATAAVLLIAIGTYYSVSQRRQPPASSSGSNEGQAAAPLAVENLDVGIWKKNDTNKSLLLDDPGALPLRAGDWMRTEVQLNRPGFIYVIYLDAAGEASPLYPWKKYDWHDRADEEPQALLHLPENPKHDGAPLTPGPSGIEVFLVLVREQRLSDEENERLHKLLQDKPQQGKFDPLRKAVWLGGNEERFGHPDDRGRPDLDLAGKVEDPVQRVRRLLKTDLRHLSDTNRAVCYPFAGE